jgi:hypothetical protein
MNDYIGLRRLHRFQDIIGIERIYQRGFRVPMNESTSSCLVGG